MRMLGVLLIGIGCATAASAEPLTTITAERRTVPDVRVYDGIVEPVHQSTVSAQTAGRIAAVLFDVDDRVEKDQILVRFADPEQRARVEHATAALKEADARAKLAGDEHQRIVNLAERKLVSTADRDRAEAALKAAQASVAAQKARLNEVQQGLDYTVVRAPYSGVVVARHVQVGEAVQPGQPLMTGFSLATLRVATWVPQAMVTTVRNTAQARIAVGERGFDVSGNAVTVFPYADKSTHGFRVWLRLPDALPDVYPGMMVKVAFRAGDAMRLVVPRAAVVQRSEVTGVYVQRGDQSVELRHIVTGAAVGDDVEVLAGLDAGEHVVTDPAAAVVQRGASAAQNREAQP